MKLIPLTQNEFAIIDDEDFELVSQYKWCADRNATTCYATRGVKLGINKWTTQRMHKFLTNWSYVDHINGNGLDNRRINLRQSNQGLNNRNQHKNWGSSSYKGVYWDKRAQKWCVRFRGLLISKHLGHFTDEIEAAKAYDLELIKVFGYDKVKLNFPTEGQI